jgi:choline dehydrogenase-like flavoprotein
MIIFSEHLTGNLLNAKMCIVGSGAAGITLACELDGAPFNVLLLEAGNLRLEKGSTQNYSGSAALPHPEPSEFRRFGFGGSTAAWGGRCVPYDPIDFERRDYISNSGWPISYFEVARYYSRAMQYCDAGEFDFSVSRSLANTQPTIPGLENDQEILSDRLERYSLPTHFGRRYRGRIKGSKNILAVLSARCVCINKSDSGDFIESVEVVDRKGLRRCLRADVFVMAVGGIETPRLLFASAPGRGGLGNHSNKLGRYYACHFGNVCARLVANGIKPAFHFEKTKDGVYCRRKLQFSDQAQHRHRLLNTVFRLHFPNYADATHGSAVMSMIYLTKSMLIPEHRHILKSGMGEVKASSTPAHLRNVISGIPQLCDFGYQWLFRRYLAKRKLPYTLVPNADGSFPIEFNSEQTPSENSRITLTHDTDQHGLRRVHVDWQIQEDDVAAAQRAFRVLQASVQRTTLCRLEFDEGQLNSVIARSVPIGGHHIGTARMAGSPNAGVVDEQCAVFYLPNLFIASAAVFPTSSHANPTLTIIALSLRLAAHLRKKLSAC